MTAHHALGYSCKPIARLATCKPSIIAASGAFPSSPNVRRTSNKVEPVGNPNIGEPSPRRTLASANSQLSLGEPFYSDLLTWIQAALAMTRIGPNIHILHMPPRKVSIVPDTTILGKKREVLAHAASARLLMSSCSIGEPPCYTIYQANNIIQAIKGKTVINCSGSCFWTNRSGSFSSFIAPSLLFHFSHFKAIHRFRHVNRFPSEGRSSDLSRIWVVRTRSRATLCKNNPYGLA